MTSGCNRQTKRDHEKGETIYMPHQHCHSRRNYSEQAWSTFHHFHGWFHPHRSSVCATMCMRYIRCLWACPLVIGKKILVQTVSAARQKHKCVSASASQHRACIFLYAYAEACVCNTQQRLCKRNIQHALCCKNICTLCKELFTLECSWITLTLSLKSSTSSLPSSNIKCFQS